VKHGPQRREMQLNLALGNAPPVTVPGDKEKELALALVELLLSKFRESIQGPNAGGGDESEANR